MPETRKAFRSASATSTCVLLMAGLLVLVPGRAVMAAEGDVFAAPRAFPTDGYPMRMALADFDGDQDADLVVSNEDGNLSILLGAGNGTLGPPTVLPRDPSTEFSDPSVGDFNADGVPDLSVAALDGVAVLLGAGNGTFGAPITYAVDQWGGVLAVGDFNDDGRDDLAVGHSDDPDGGVSIHLAVGDGAFGAPALYIGGMDVHSLAVGDFNGDLADDLAASGGHFDTDAVSVLLGARDGNFQTNGVYFADAEITSPVAVGDFNGDDHPDIAFGGRSVILGAGDGTFGDPIVSPDRPAPMVAADFDGDGADDLAALPDYSDAVLVFLAVGDGTFDEPLDIAMGSLSSGIAADDFDGDGTVDLVAGNGQDGAVGCIWVLRGVGDGTFQVAPTYRAGPEPSSVASADFNGDGAADLAAANPGANTVSVLLARGDGTFRSRSAYEAGSEPSDVTVGDLNGDGASDIIVTNLGANAVSVLLGSGNGTFSAPAQYSAGPGPNSVAIGDFDGDGDDDVAVANTWWPSSVSTLLGSGDGTLGPPTSYSVADGPTSITAGKFNGDTRDDLVVYTAAGVSILLAVDGGVFGAPTSYPVVSDLGSVSVGDFNADGFDDVAIDSGYPEVSVLLAQGDGTFGGPTGHLVGDWPEMLAAGDFNADGAADLVTITRDCNCVAVLLAAGNGTFADPVRYAVAGASGWGEGTSLTVGDFDSDAGLDLAVARSGHDDIAILLNTFQGRVPPPPPPVAPPIPVADAYSTTESVTLVVAAAEGVLANDSDPSGRPMTTHVSTGPAHGTLSLSADGSFIYVPEPGWSGIDNFTYTASNGVSESGPAAVTVFVNAPSVVNDPPVASDDSYEARTGETLTIPAPGVLANDVDSDGDLLTVTLVTGPAHGTLSLGADGSFVYLPAAGWAGVDVFTYKASDGRGGTGQAVVYVSTTEVLGVTVSRGYWLVASDGGIFSFGDSRFLGSTGNIRLNRPIVGMAATPTGLGYWLVASDGGIFSFGDARFFGSTGAINLNKPIIGMAATPTGLGYWLVASDGGIFTFGDAAFLGSTGELNLNKRIVGMAATPTGLGYWLVASDGGIFAFGDAGFFGSTGNIALNRPIGGMAATPTGLGYWLLASDGGIFAFGDARFFGSTGAMHLNQLIVGMAATPTGLGYLFVASDGGIFAFGDAAFLGSTGNIALNLPIITMATRR